jgi:hypothetical protein
VDAQLTSLSKDLRFATCIRSLGHRKGCLG